MELFYNTVVQMNKYLWGWPMVILLMGTHIYMTIRTGFIQRKIYLAIKLSVTKDKDAQGDVSAFGALSTALASTIGTGNIIGVGTAIALGGPGAVLWMWISGIFGIATKYSESLIGVKYRVQTSDGTMLGGAMYAFETALKCKLGGVIFAVLTSLAAFGIGCIVQTNAVSSAVNANFGVPYGISGIIITVSIAVVILGGVKSITRVCTKLVPFMAAFYMIGCLIILYINRVYIGEALSLICTSAFSTRAAGGGFVGAGIMAATRYGVARGLFSNEAGMGSAPIVDAAAQTRNAARQALVSSSGVFWDTVVLCALTGLVLVTTIISNPAVAYTETGAFANGATLTSHAFSQIPVIGPIVLVGGLITFAFSTILGWSYYGERGMEYLFGKKGIMPYRILFVIIVFIGSIMALSLVWEVADALNALMALPNIIAILLLSNMIARDTQYYVYDGHINEKDNTPIPFINNR